MIPEESSAEKNLLDSYWSFLFETAFKKAVSAPFDILPEELLLRENLLVLTTIEQDGNFYSVIPLLMEGPTLKMVSHSNPADDSVTIAWDKNGNFPMSSGAYPNFFYHESGTFFWTVCPRTRLKLGENNTDKIILNDIRTIVLTLDSGEEISYAISPPCTMLEILPTGTEVTGFYYLDAEGNRIDS